MSSDLKTSEMLPGVHRVKAQSRDGSKVTEYWYAWRSGPQILKVTARSDDELARLVSAAAPAAIEKFKEEAGSNGGDKVTIYGLITRYLPQLDDEVLADRTRRDLRKFLDKVRNDLGAMEIKALESKKARPLLIKWRDRYKKTPKSADERMKALSRALNWAVDHGELSRNPVADVDPLYVPPDRSEIIWEPHHLEIAYRHADQEFVDAIDFLGNGGSRLGDARRLQRNVVKEDAIIYQTGKSNRRRTVVIPITDGMRVVLNRLPESPKSTTLLNSSRGTPWSEPGLESALQRLKKKALAEAVARRGPDATSGIEHLRLHDLRGTAATHFMRWGLEDRDIAEILGWTPEQVREIRRRYVSGNEIALAMLRRIKANRAALEAEQKQAADGTSKERKL